MTMVLTAKNEKGWQPERITVVGIGLLGASLIEAAKRVWPDLKVSGVSSENTLKKAMELGLITEGFAYSDLDEACLESDLVVLCTPIDQIKKTLVHWGENPLKCKPGCIITDVGSTKTEICKLGLASFKPDFSILPTALAYRAQSTIKIGGGIFIGSHPMAGSEKTGLEARDALLFQNASWVICGEDSISQNAEFSSHSSNSIYSDALARLIFFAQALGARTTLMSAVLHDEVAANVSHLPQLLATTLASYIGDKKNVVDNCLQIAGSGFKDMTRLAASAFSVWEPILKSNHENILEALAGFEKYLVSLESALKENKSGEFFKAGNELRGQISKAKKGFGIPLSEILVDLEDKPGMLVQVFSPLAEKKINVLDVEILKVREGEGGTVLLGFHGADEAEKAVQCLVSLGFKARLK